MITASIVIFHNLKNELQRVISCVLNSPVSILYLVDNSINDSLRALTDLSPRIRYIHNANIGYGGAHNIAIREAFDEEADYHVVINPDIFFEKGVLETLTNYMDASPDVGLVMPEIQNPSGERQYLCKLLPTPMDLFFRRFFPSVFFLRSRQRFELRFSGYDKEMNVPFLSGCFMFLRTDALRKAGVFDERFFMYGEDIDLSRRIHRQYKTMYYPYAKVIHVHEAASYKSTKMLIVHIKNIVKYFNKWGWFLDKERRQMNRKILRELNYLR